MSQEPIKYDASHIKVLQGLEAVRKRPGMYVGSTGERGLHHLVFEAAGRALNEVLAGRAGLVEVVLLPDGGIRVADDGPGATFEPSGAVDDPGLEILLTRLSVGASPRIHVMPGVGLALVNALSSRLVAEVWREGIQHVREYVRSIEVTPPSDAGSTGGSGTSITFWPDADIFQTTEFSFYELAERFRELAFLNRELDISLTDERSSELRSVRFRSLGGVRDMVAFLDEPAAELVHPEIISFELEDPRMAGTMEVAVRWRITGEERVRSFANSVPTPHGGTHVVGFRRGVSAAVNAYAREQGLLAADADFDTDLVVAGMTAVVSVKLEYPEFEGATRGILGNAAVHTCVRESVQEELGGWLEKHPEQAAALIERIIQRARRD